METIVSNVGTKYESCLFFPKQETTPGRFQMHLTVTGTHQREAYTARCGCEYFVNEGGLRGNR